MGEEGRPRVVVIGGGVAGLSAAHELTRRRFDVTVYERSPLFGGKARSFDHVAERDGLTYVYPAEHGFRFFPRFYRHLTDTMRRIPYLVEEETLTRHRRARMRVTRRTTTYDNLVECSEGLLALDGKRGLQFGARFPRSRSEWRGLAESWRAIDGLELAEGELDFFGARLWELMTSSDSREANDYERIGWQEFLEANGRSKPYHDFLVAGITRNLVAAKPELASARVGGRILAQLILGLLSPGEGNDRVLCGPTHEKWIDPWVAYLLRRGVKFFPSSCATEIYCDDGCITGIKIERRSGEKTEAWDATADFYILAVPVECALPLITSAMISIDPTLSDITRLAEDTEKMVGIQFYMKKEVPIINGHVSYADSEWALTSISQAQFWDVDLGYFGFGKLRDIISVDISDWNKLGKLEHQTDGNERRQKAAKDCTPEEIAADVWAQMKEALNVEGKVVLNDDDVLDWHLCSNCVEHGDFQDRLLINKRNSWWYRPEAFTRIPNLFLASDYVRTNTSLATMEAANEAARRAVNGIIDRAVAQRMKGADLRQHCRIWDLSRPRLLANYRRRDDQRYRRGQPADGYAGRWARAAYRIAMLVVAVFSGGSKAIEEAFPSLSRRRRPGERRPPKSALAREIYEEYVAPTKATEPTPAPLTH